MFMFFSETGYWKSRESPSIVIPPTLNGIQTLRNCQISANRWQVTFMDAMRFIRCMEHYKPKVFVIQIEIFFVCIANSYMFWQKCKSIISYMSTKKNTHENRFLFTARTRFLQMFRVSYARKISKVWIN